MSNWPTRDEIRAMFPTKEGFGSDVTLAVLAQVPEVAALIEALRDMRRQFSPYPSEDTERWREEHEACERADAALAALEPKP